MEAARPSHLTWTDLLSWPEDDGNRYELLDGELVVSPSPGLRHQQAVVALTLALGNWARTHSGTVLTGPFDVYVHEREFTEPDVLYVRPERTHLFEERRIAAPPDLLVEVLVFRLGEAGYGEPAVLGAGSVLEPGACPGLAVPVDEILPPRHPG